MHSLNIPIIPSLELANMADFLLRKIFQSSNVHLFLSEYQQKSDEFEKKLTVLIQSDNENDILEKNDFLNDSYTIDYFNEFTRPFLTKKSKVINQLYY